MYWHFCLFAFLAAWPFFAFWALFWRLFVHCPKSNVICITPADQSDSRMAAPPRAARRPIRLSVVRVAGEAGASAVAGSEDDDDVAAAPWPRLFHYDAHSTTHLNLREASGRRETYLSHYPPDRAATVSPRVMGRGGRDAMHRLK